MKKIKIITAAEFAQFVALYTGLPFEPEDRTYAAFLPVEWFVKTPWYGLKKLYYTEQANDCDDFCVWLEEYWRGRYFDDYAGGGWSEFGNNSYPAIPRCRVKICTASGSIHWIELVAAVRGGTLVPLFVERTEEDIQPVLMSNISKFLKVQS